MTSNGHAPNEFILPDGRVALGKNPTIIENERGFERVAGLMNRQEWRQLHAVLRSQFFLFKNDGGDYGERMICKARNPDGSWRGCGLQHMYFSSYCIEMPFRGGEGLEQGLWLSFRTARTDVRKRQILGTISKLPDLAEGHPLTARDLAPKDPGENWLGILLSLPEPIKVDKAVQLATKINEKNPPQPFCLVPTCFHFVTPNTDCARGLHVITPAVV